MSALARRLHSWLVPLLLSALLLPWLSGGWSPAGGTTLMDLVPLGGPKPSPVADANADSTFEGKFELAKVRIQGIPVISVASPVTIDGRPVIHASSRASVIEGNLRALYDPNQICSFSERVSEWLLDQVLRGDSRVCAAFQRYGLERSGAPISLEVVRESNGLYQLAARLPGRVNPFPLLTVTKADAEINGARELALAQVWRRRLEDRINFARKMSAPDRLARRWRLILVLELLLAGLTAATVFLWNRMRQRIARLQRELREQRRADHRVELRLHAEQALAIAVLLLLICEAVLMLGLGVMAIPGQVPLGIELLLQPSYALGKFLVVTVVTLLLRGLTTFLLSQWALDVDVAQHELARRQQRYRSLVRVCHRLINVLGVLAVGLWILLDIPGVRSTSVSLVLAGGALLGALALVFQGLLRDFTAGLVMLLEDRYAIGDWIEVDDHEGEVIDVGLFSTQVRCLDQRVHILNNALIQQLRNHTKLRSGSLVTLLISHRQQDLETVFQVLSEEIDAFRRDPIWSARLIGEPVLRGVKRSTALGVHMQVLLITRVGEQWATEREFQRRALQALHRRGVQIADGLELMPSLPPADAR